METQAENTKENVQKEKEVSDKTRKLKQKKCTKEKIPKKTRMPLDERHQKKWNVTKRDILCTYSRSAAFALYSLKFNHVQY